MVFFDDRGKKKATVMHLMKLWLIYVKVLTTFDFSNTMVSFIEDGKKKKAALALDSQGANR